MMPPEFAKQLLAARYRPGLESRAETRHVVLDGPHCTMFEQDPSAVAALGTYLDDLLGAAANREFELEAAGSLEATAPESPGERARAVPSLRAVSNQVEHLVNVQANASSNAGGLDSQSGKWNI
eukprot:TRINITY_DN29191_c0_g1_i3.p3 TRINITY_DN29191_c0_g1~~TRINITY_DN29191_c0_g1_i3.p3  ORF type:complete len:124 (-),score=16.48 TRINITY_DN29191_c0_g1_i3:214-585(-)